MRTRGPAGPRRYTRLMLGVVAQAPDLIWVLLVPVLGLAACIVIGTAIFASWMRFRRR